MRTISPQMRYLLLACAAVAGYLLTASFLSIEDPGLKLLYASFLALCVLVIMVVMKGSLVFIIRTFAAMQMLLGCGLAGFILVQGTMIGMLLEGLKINAHRTIPADAAFFLEKLSVRWDGFTMAIFPAALFLFLMGYLQLRATWRTSRESSNDDPGGRL